MSSSSSGVFRARVGGPSATSDATRWTVSGERGAPGHKQSSAPSRSFLPVPSATLSADLLALAFQIDSILNFSHLAARRQFRVTLYRRASASRGSSPPDRPPAIRAVTSPPSRAGPQLHYRIGLGVEARTSTGRSSQKFLFEPRGRPAESPGTRTPREPTKPARGRIARALHRDFSRCALTCADRPPAMRSTLALALLACAAALVSAAPAPAPAPIAGPAPAPAPAIIDRGDGDPGSF
ncbi:uncharacterized protein C8Q71DRAFT_911155 [Rhodofomes roseus]|uniref:Uncharacterized protein n=1 Tax=Rhodofomes roseus TaxID=34475 RepID=A0ABQ8K235_9APHY|nr:uncharacterized protein C8Q71DRAFT_911155 [Rhodofomes roseus]KAH9830565.1 hypothetical protein C8Q71DRAFT_911155 [Rhodofomes roseus]